jgi:hypothetical protein
MTQDNREMLLELAASVDRLQRYDNALDVKIELALFEPDEDYASIRANAAGTKVIYTGHDGKEATFWAQDWTGIWDRAKTAASLRAHATQGSDSNG